MPQDKSFDYSDIEFGTILLDLIENENITDIMCWENEVWITDINAGHYKLNFEKYSSEDQEDYKLKLGTIPRQLAIKMSAPFNEGCPTLDGEADYKGKSQLRLNAIHESVTISGKPVLAFRNSPYKLRINEKKIIENNFATKEILSLLEVAIYSGCNVMISGETGSGKTTLLKYLARYIRKNEAIITIEDTAEAFLKKIYPEKNILALKTTQTANYRDLLRSCLRQNPDWICLSETRNEEVLELLEAAGTGHKLISTIHANGALKIPDRMVDMSKLTGQGAERVLMQVHRNIDIGLYIQYWNDKNGSHRRIMDVCEYYVNENQQPVRHLLAEYVDNSYKYSLIKSPQILRNISSSRTFVGTIKGIFING